MNEQNIRELKEQLLSIGFEVGLELALRRNLCFHPLRFTLQQGVERGGDRLKFRFYYEKAADENTYVCSCYDAVLYKEIQIPDVTTQEFNSKELEERMAAINWKVEEILMNASVAQLYPVDGQREEAIESLVSILQLLERSEEGRQLVRLLKLKYWWDTPAERYMENLSSLKSQYEASQRFYFLEGAEVITIEEAYRFLNNKWMEKRLYVQKKESTAEQQKASTANKGTGTGKVKKTTPGRKGK